MPAALTIPQLRSQAATHAKHARLCKKAIDVCPTCKTTIAWFRELPPDVLNQVLEDRGRPVRG
jgi:hypothetical protein